MAGVQRGNVFLNVPDEDIQKYMAKGFSLVDPITGKVIKQSVPTELGQLQKAYSEHEATIKKLMEENAQLKALLEEKSKKKEKATEPEPEPEGWDDWQDDEPKKPVRGKKSK